MIYDVIIIGMGPAGVSSAIYLKRAGLKVLTLDGGPFGGTLNYIDKIDNYPGMFGTSGPDLAFKLYEHCKALEIDFKNEKVLNIIDGVNKTIVTSEHQYNCKNVIIATGRIPKKLGLFNENELVGKGVSNCALCDGAFYRNKDVAVVGGGISALSEALYLSNICKNVYLIHRRNNFSVRNLIVDEVLSKDNIQCIMESTIDELCVDNGKLNGIIVNGQKIAVEGLFTYIGFEPKVDFVDELNICDKNGYINVDLNFETDIKGIFAIGDVIKKDVYQIVTAMADGVCVSNVIIKRS